MKIMVSACLAGENCKYDGGNNKNERVLKLLEGNESILVCPEQMGGLPTPRLASEVCNGIVTRKDGRIVDEEFRSGAQKCLEIALDKLPDLIVLQSRSPSCGVKQRYDGTFTGTLTGKPGVTAQLLMENGFRVMDVEDLLVTDRLFLRKWDRSDAEDLYRYAKDPDVGPIAGWPAHQSVDESRDVIQNVLTGKQAYAICRKTENKTIGAIELKLKGHTDLTDREDECELGFWIGKPFWGQGFMPEAAGELIRHGFEDLGMNKIWCAYYDGNVKSKRVQEKCGFRYQWTSQDVDVPLMHEKRIGHVNCLTREEWLGDHPDHS